MKENYTVLFEQVNGSWHFLIIDNVGGAQTLSVPYMSKKSAKRGLERFCNRFIKKFA